jgi:hypothetical protein
MQESKYSVTYLATGGKGTQGVKRSIRLTKTFLSREKMQAWINDAENGDIEGFIDFISISENTDLKESFRPGYGMVPAPINDKTYKAKGLRKLWGIPMRAGKWADTFVGLFSDGRFAIINADDIIYYSNVNDFEAAFEKYRKTNKLREGFYSIPNDEYFNDLTEAIESGSLIKAKILLSEYA